MDDPYEICNYCGEEEEIIGESDGGWELCYKCYEDYLDHKIDVDGDLAHL